MSRELRNRVKVRIALLFVLAAVSGVLAFAVDGPRVARIGWTITAAAWAFTAICVYVAYRTDVRRGNR
ncbi:hypothetical protein ACFV9C_44280 [Kribbella sp. NPDC059898]|uniref:hypothetical protein n=1 Tax=Kribbella sp. NPDC059898 TaxID=3346995 RepID=UPI0036481AAB